MKDHRIHFAALLALLFVVPAATKAPAPKAAASKTGISKAIAWVADRRVVEPDIRRAAVVLANDPLRTRNHAAWRQELLDLCVDRELLALEAERSGFLKQEDVRRRIDRASADYLYGEVRDRFLIPALTPTAAQIDTARAGGLFRRAKIAMILTLTDRKTLYEVSQALRHGARFDSVAEIFSIHPSAAKGGEIGWRFVGALNASSWREFQNAKPGDILGPYANADSHEMYRVESIEEPTDPIIREAMMHDRMLEMESRYKVGLLQKYHFRLNPDAVSAAIFTSATEPVDSILASLDENGHRPKRDIHPSLGTIATVDGDSLDYRDLAAPELVSRGPDGKAKMEDSRALLSMCTAAVLPRLIERDARERSLDRDPVVVRRLRLIGEEISTRAMVAHAVPLPDSTAVVAYARAHASRYRKSAGHRAFVAMFADEDTARAALARWDRKAARDSFFILGGFDPMPHATARNLFYRHYGEAVFFDDDQDPLSVAVRGLMEGQISPLIPTPNGYAIAQVTGSEPARDATLDEARISAWIEARETAENAWVTSQLQHLRTATPARTAPALLNAVRLGMVPETGGNRR
jgi:hypothetical protein